ncbi:S-layer homology domain-containing protein [Bacillus sp. FJAT-27231]|uniref:S-layer homology domain-containing protein n=1 Tax=Bacillus sp. FJAT-27231 TaxID=1679168 RepID=UPI00067079B5|nr:S-layer homology domain-containing protein [Bacillus sp. FJAT-27231]
MKKYITALFVSLFIVVIFNGISVSAAQGAFEQSYNGTIADDNTEDQYTYTLAKSGTLTINLQSYMEAVNWEVRDENNKQIWRNSVWYGKTGNPAKDQYSVDLEEGNYTVIIQRHSYSYNGDYMIKASFEESKATEIEPNNGTEIAEKISLPQAPITGFISWNDSEDYYEFEVKKAGKVTVQLDSYIEAVYFNLINYETGKSVWGNTSVWYGKPETPKKEFLNVYLEPGKYYAKVSKHSYGYTGKYKIKVSYATAGNTEIENNNGTVTAQVFPISGTVKGLISWNDRDDYYKLRVKEPTKANIKVSASFRSKVSLLDENGDRLERVTTYNGEENNPQTQAITYSLIPNKDYFFYVTGESFNDQGIYTLTIPELQPVNVQFKDVTSAYRPAVDYLVRHQITSGLSKTEFGISKNINRADAAVWLAKTLNLDIEAAKNSGFVDVPARAVGAVNALKEAGIIGGKTDTRFGAYDPLTRGEIAIILQRAYNLSGNGQSSSFTDVSDRYKEAVNALVANGVTNGISARSFGVSQKLTRGQLAIFIYRLSSK